MKNPRTVTVTTALIFMLIAGIAALLIGAQLGIHTGKKIGFEQGKAQANHSLTMNFIDQKYLTAECRQWAIWKTKGGWKG